ncbi:hypothetical protein FACS18942_07220 [Planctomycetales bacterium]|nr:hypothetical protein FACS18942_07220 [Planctomycetales bacterium]GHT37263.1 hypothetical protein FACS189427_09990 [Planctomycetales bacterium]
MMLYLITPDNKLLHYFRRAAQDNVQDNNSEIIQFRNEDNVFRKAKQNLSAVLFAQWTVSEIPAVIERITHRNTHLFEGRLFVYVPDLPKKTVNSGIEIRFALLQAGITAVFGSMREIEMQHFF